jgi:hypothetical protein
MAIEKLVDDIERKENNNQLRDEDDEKEISNVNVQIEQDQ